MLKKELIAQGLNIGVEELSETIVIDSAPVEVIPEVAAPEAGEIEASVLESAQAENNVETINTAIDNLSATSAALEAFGEIIRDSLDNGGLYPQTAGVIQTSINTMLSYNGFSAVNVIPAMESFGGSADRRDSSVASLEGVSEVVSKVWEGILALIEKFKAALVSWFDAEDKKLAVLEKFAGAIRFATKNQTQKEGDFKADATISFNTSVSSAGIISGFKAADKLLGNLGKVVHDKTAVVQKTFASIKPYLDGVDGGHWKQVDGSREAINELGKKTLGEFKEAIGEWKSDEFIGDRVATLTADDFSVSTAHVDTNKLDLTVPLLNPKETEMVSKQVEATIGNLRTARKALEDGIKEWEKTSTSAKGLLDALEGELPSFGGNIKTIATWSKHFSVARLVLQGVTESSFHALKYCAASQGKGEAKAA